MPASNSAFVSYRRDPGYASAKLIYDGLRRARIDAFLDLESMNAAGDFDVKILNQIAGRPYFVLVLTDGTLDRCTNPGDWLWREVEFAASIGRIMVPAMIPPFDIGDADRFLPSPEVAAVLKKSNGVEFPPAYFDAALVKLVERLQPTSLEVRTFSPADRKFARRAKRQFESSPDRRRWVLAVAGVVLVLGVIGLFLAIDRDGADSTATTTTSPVLGDRLEPNELLEPGQRLVNGRHTLEMTAEGRLVASTEGRPWWSPTAAHAGAVARMQDDGNFVVYRSVSSTEPGDALWASGTHGNRDAELRLEDSGGRGVVAIDAPDGRRLFRKADEPEPDPVRPTEPTTTVVDEVTVPSVGPTTTDAGAVTTPTT